MCTLLAPIDMLTRVRRLLRFELLATALLVFSLASSASAQATLDYSTVTRMEDVADTTFTFTGTFMGGGGGSLGMTVVVTKGASLGTFPLAADEVTPAVTAPSPYKDGEVGDGGDGVTILGLDTETDIGVQFDPDFVFPPVTSPITITITFDSGADVGGLTFLITDIDSSGTTGNFRRDRVDITALNDMGAAASAPTLTAVSGAPTFTILPSGAEATGSAGAASMAPANTDLGNLQVTFSERIRSVTITYSDTGGSNNPAIRGIGLLADLTIDEPVPVELMSFSVE